MAKMLLKYLDSFHSKHASSCGKHHPTVIEELCHQFSVANVRKSTNNFDDRQRIGIGSTSTVYKGCLEHNGATDYAIALKWESHQAILEFKNEIELLCQLIHPNLVSLIGFCDHQDEKILVYKYMSNGTLEKILHDWVKRPLSWKKRLEICIGTARGLHYLHSGTKRTIFHRNINTRNILLDNNMVPKLTGFSLCLKGPHFMSKPKPIQVDALAGTIDYMAPEYVQTNSFTDRCDVYSFGMVLLEVVCAMKPQTIFGCLSPVEENIDPVLKEKIAPESWEIFMEITKRCLKIDPNERPIIGEVEVQLEHAVSLQEEADIRNTNGYHTLSSTTIIES